MTDERKKEEVEDAMLEGGKVDPRKTFYLAMFDIDLNGYARVDWDGNIAFQSPELALEHAKETAEGGGTVIVLQCIPFKLVQQGKVRVTDMKPKR